MSFDYSGVWSNWDPWRSIPAEYNLGEALTRGQVQAGRGDVVAAPLKNAAHTERALDLSPGSMHLRPPVAWRRLWRGWG